MGCFLGQLLLNKSAYSASIQRSVLLRHTDPSYSGALKQKLCEEEEILKKQSTSYVFYPTEVKINIEKLEVIFIGDRQTFVAGKQVSEEREGYLFQFSYTGSKLLLKGLSAHEISNGGA